MEVYYQNAFPAVTVPAAQTALYPDTQFGMTQPGSAGFAWHEVEIAKVGNTVTWKMDGTLLITLDTTNFVGGLPAGTNISFGHADINTGQGTHPNYPFVAFTLIDNVVVEALTAGPDADFDDDMDVDGDDLADWVATFGGAATGTTGDANGDGLADGADFLEWQQQFTGPAMASAVPEPANWCSALLAALVLAALRGPRRQPAVAMARSR
jgi:hypothetical protein